jgi:hypothetical protein
MAKIKEADCDKCKAIKVSIKNGSCKDHGNRRPKPVNQPHGAVSRDRSGSTSYRAGSDKKTGEA